MALRGSEVTCQDNHCRQVVRMKSCRDKAHYFYSLEAFLTQSVTISLLLDTVVCIHGPDSTGGRLRSPDVHKDFSAVFFLTWLTESLTDSSHHTQSPSQHYRSTRRMLSSGTQYMQNISPRESHSWLVHKCSLGLRSQCLFFTAGVRGESTELKIVDTKEGRQWISPGF